MSATTTEPTPQMEPETMGTTVLAEPTPTGTAPKPAAPKKARSVKKKAAAPEAAAPEAAETAEGCAPEPPQKKARKQKAKDDTPPPAAPGPVPEAAAPEPAAPAGKKKKEAAPRRKSAFDVFRGEFCKAKRGTGMAFQDVAKACCEEWKALGEEDKAKWEAKREELYPTPPPSDKPKKPPTAWILYLNDYRGKLKEAGETLSVPEVTKKAAEVWKTLDAEAKAAWKPAVA